MNKPLSLSLLSIALLLGSADAQAIDATLQNAGLPPLPANRIVGTWQSDIALRPCAGGPVLVNGSAMATFHAGGTLTDTAPSPPMLRSPGHGGWRYLGGDRYQTRFVVYQFLPTGVYDGYFDIRTTVILGANRSSNTSSIVARRHNADDSLRIAMCGDGVGERIAVD